MPLKKPSLIALAMILTGMAAPPFSAGQEAADDTVWVELDCMQSTSSDYAAVETEIWLPIHQQRVKQGELAGWALYSVLYGAGSDCDHYTVNTYRGLAQLNADKAFAEHFATAHPGKSWDEAMRRTLASRSHASTELWTWVDGIPAGEHRYVEVNQMHAEDGQAYVQLERQTWKRVHQALVDGGHMAGWGLYGLVSPHGGAIPYNFQTINFLKRIGPLPVEEAMRAALSEADAAAVENTPAVRDHLLGEVWVLVASTE